MRSPTPIRVVEDRNTIRRMSIAAPPWEDVLKLLDATFRESDRLVGQVNEIFTEYCPAATLRMPPTEAEKTDSESLRSADDWAEESEQILHEQTGGVIRLQAKMLEYVVENRDSICEIRATLTGPNEESTSLASSSR